MLDKHFHLCISQSRAIVFVLLSFELLFSIHYFSIPLSGHLFILSDKMCLQLITWDHCFIFERENKLV